MLTTATATDPNHEERDVHPQLCRRLRRSAPDHLEASPPASSTFQSIDDRVQAPARAASSAQAGRHGEPPGAGSAPAAGESDCPTATASACQSEPWSTHGPAAAAAAVGCDASVDDARRGAPAPAAGQAVWWTCVSSHTSNIEDHDTHTAPPPQPLLLRHPRHLQLAAVVRLPSLVVNTSRYSRPTLVVAPPPAPPPPPPVRPAGGRASLPSQLSDQAHADPSRPVHSSRGSPTSLTS